MAILVMLLLTLLLITMIGTMIGLAMAILHHDMLNHHPKNMEQGTRPSAQDLGFPECNKLLVLKRLFGAMSSMIVLIGVNLRGARTYFATKCTCRHLLPQGEKDATTLRLPLKLTPMRECGDPSMATI